MKKYILAGVFVLSMLISTSSSVASINPYADVDPSPNTPSCASINNNLRYQSRDINTDGEVSTLQDFLQAQSYLNSEPTGYFGLLTVAAVKSFQIKSGIEGTGYVGPLTRARIAAVTCGTETTPTSGPTVSIKLSDSISSNSSYLLNKTVTWSSTGMTSCFADSIYGNGQKLSDNLGWETSGWYGNRKTSGTEFLQIPVIDGITSLIITCNGAMGSKSASVSVKSNVTQSDAYKKGCTSTKGFSSTTGEPCGTFLPGCSSTQGFSSTTGEYCDGSHPKQNYPEPSVEVKSNNGEKIVNAQKGEFVYVNWTSKNTSSCTAVGSAWDRTQLSDVLTTSGYIGVAANVSAEYTISCKGSNKTVSDSMKINVTQACLSSGYDSRGFRCGCSSTSGFSSTTGESCSPNNPKNPNPFTDANYNQTSSTSLSTKEKTATYQYPDNPCGTLMTDHSEVGSVSVGRGPVYNMASNQCGSGFTPDDSSFRTYSCNNSFSSSTGSVVGNATFAFQCKVQNSNFPAGCSSSNGWSSTTGQSCGYQSYNQ